MRRGLCRWSRQAFLISGASKEALESVFDSPTGYEAYASRNHTEPRIRTTYGVRVVVKKNTEMESGYFVLTAFPINFGE
jgi:hypothetical protein